MEKISLESFSKYALDYVKGEKSMKWSMFAGKHEKGLQYNKDDIVFAFKDDGTLKSIETKNLITQKKGVVVRVADNYFLIKNAIVWILKNKDMGLLHGFISFSVDREKLEIFKLDETEAFMMVV